MSTTKKDRRYETFEQFYPFYISQHSNSINRKLHVIGSLLALIQLLRCIILTFNWISLISVPLIGYSMAWIGHFCFQKNSPATFRYPFFSLRGDFRMLKQVLTGQRPF